MIGNWAVALGLSLWRVHKPTFLHPRLSWVSHLLKDPDGFDKKGQVQSRTGQRSTIRVDEKQHVDG